MSLIIFNAIGQGLARRFFPLVFVICSLFVVSCGRKSSGTIAPPPPTLPLSRPVIGYGVVNTSYTQVLDQPVQGSVSLGYLRRGAVVQVLERTASWIKVKGQYLGWIKEEGVNIYDNESKAETASSLVGAETADQ
jgi:hypothetical protein